MTGSDDLSGLLAPASVAIIGASNRDGNLGGAAAGHLGRYGYKGSVWPVHPSEQSVAGFACYPDLASLPGVPDVAILAIPAAGLVDAVEQCGFFGIRNAIAWAGGFAEAGEEGRGQQALLTDACMRYGIRLCGPNCLGIVNSATGFTGTFSSSLLDMEELTKGSIAMVSQSGGIATVTLALAQRAGFGFRYVVSCGNEAVLSITDFMRAVARDSETRVVSLYVEAITDGTAFLDVLHELRVMGKPVVILKGGASEASGRASLAHTGRLAGSDRAFDAAIREAAAIRVHSVEELLDVSLLAASLGTCFPQGRGVALTTFGGGAGVLAVDQCERAGLQAPLPSAVTSEWLAARLPPIAAIGNPVDLTPQSVNDPRWRAQLPGALEALLIDENFDTLLFLSAAMRNREREVTQVIQTLRKRSAIPIVVSWPLASAEAVQGLLKIGVYAFPEHARAARAIGHLARWQEELKVPVPGANAMVVPHVDWPDMIVSAKEPLVVSEHEVAAMLRRAGLFVAAGELARSESELAGLAKKIDFPWVLKGISPAVTHRAAAGLLLLDIASLSDSRVAYEQLQRQAYANGITLDGCYVQQMVPEGQELLFAAFRDATFGVMITCAAGGNLTELIDDAVSARAPLGHEAAALAIGRLRIMRGTAALGPESLFKAAAYLSRFSALAATMPWASFTFELNPVKCSDAQAIAVDGLLVIDKP